MNTKKKLYCITYCDTVYPDTDYEEIVEKIGFIYATDEETAKDELEVFLYKNFPCMHLFSGFKIRVNFTEKDIVTVPVQAMDFYDEVLEE